MKDLLSKCTKLVGHNIIMYDVPVLEKILGVRVEARLVDTLTLSWYLFPNRVRHGLESFGEEFGKPKVEIDDWENLSVEEYTNRCETDVWINFRLWETQRNKLKNLYGSVDKAEKLIRYLAFKMDCLREQYRSGWKVDILRAKSNFDKLSIIKDDKVEALKSIMPKVPIVHEFKKPAKPFKKDSTYSVAGALWFSRLKEKELPTDYEGVIESIVGYEEPNPGSSQQVKNWLFSLGWKPRSFKYTKLKDGSENIVPQIRIEGDEGKELCPSVLELISVEPGIQVLQDLTVVTHRLDIFKNFLKFEKDGYLRAEAQGLTNTLRFKHKNPLVNLPGVSKPYGKEIRGCLIAPEGTVLCGSDMVSLESTTKRHYMYPYDPDYVEEMSDPMFDEHLDLAKQAGEVSQADIEDYINGLAPHIKPIRSKFKPANYACVYGVQAPRLSRETGLPESEAQRLIDVYWQRNWSVKELCKHIEIKKLGGEMWLLNPVSGLYYSLRYMKDIFSTLNQGTGVYCFDSWILEWRKKRPQITGQFHDEIISCIPEGKEEAYETILREAVTRVNKKLNLNIKLDVDVKFGKTYADIH